jgi:hypothetical protein
MQRSLIDITDSDLKEIQKLAGLFFTPKEIAVMLEMNPTAFYSACNVEGNDIYNAFTGGRLQGEVDLRESIMKMAKAGSSPAQTMALDMLKQSKLKLMDHG